jgi:hypothetical protein
VHLFLMRACHSGASFVMAFERETQQAFLEGHVAALEWFGGVFDLIRYDNLKAAVVRVLKGRRRTESDRFVALRSHYMFESSLCISGKRCQWPSVSPRGWPSVLPVGGHVFSPLVAMGSPHGVGLRGGSV